MRHLIVAFVIGLVALAGAKAHGQGPQQDTRSRAKALYTKGMAHYNVGKYLQACEEFEEGYLAKPDPAFLFNLGQCHRQLGRLDEAVRDYRAFIREQPNASNRIEIEERIAAMEDEIHRQQAVQPPTGTQAPSSEPSSHPVAGAPAPPIRLPERQLPLTPTASGDTDRSGLKLVLEGGGIAVAVAGAAMAAAGIYFLAINGSGTCDLAPGQEACPEVHTTQALGLGLMIPGAVLAVGGMVAAIIGFRLPQHASVAITPSHGGAKVAAAIRF